MLKQYKNPSKRQSRTKVHGFKFQIQSAYNRAHTLIKCTATYLSTYDIHLQTIWIARIYHGHIENASPKMKQLFIFAKCFVCAFLSVWIIYTLVVYFILLRNSPHGNTFAFSIRHVKERGRRRAIPYISQLNKLYFYTFHDCTRFDEIL